MQLFSPPSSGTDTELKQEKMKSFLILKFTQCPQHNRRNQTMLIIGIVVPFELN